MSPPTNARPIDRLLAEYGERHRGGTNKAIHWICVPVIAWTVIALFWSLPSPFGIWWVNWATLLLAASLIYHLVLSPALAVGFGVFGLISVHLIIVFEASWPLPLWQFALGVFVLAWIGQFRGHRVGGKNPGFLKDIQLLLIGPAWLISFLYRRWGIPY